MACDQPIDSVLLSCNVKMTGLGSITTIDDCSALLCIVILCVVVLATKLFIVWYWSGPDVFLLRCTNIIRLMAVLLYLARLLIPIIFSWRNYCWLFNDLLCVWCVQATDVWWRSDMTLLIQPDGMTVTFRLTKSRPNNWYQWYSTVLIIISQLVIILTYYYRLWRNPIIIDDEELLKWLTTAIDYCCGWLLAYCEWRY